MVELTPTSILDPWVEGWAKEAGMSTKNLAGILGGDLAGGLVGVPLDIFLTQLGSKLASGALGLLGLLVGTHPLKGQGRLQSDTMHIGSRLLTEILDPSPDDIKAIQRNIGDLIDGLFQGKWEKVAYAFVRNPREITGLLPKGAPSENKQKAAADEKKEVSKTQRRLMYL